MSNDLRIINGEAFRLLNFQIDEKVDEIRTAMINYRGAMNRAFDSNNLTTISTRISAEMNDNSGGSVRLPMDLHALRPYFNELQTIDEKIREVRELNHLKLRLLAEPEIAVPGDTVIARVFDTEREQTVERVLHQIDVLFNSGSQVFYDIKEAIIEFDNDSTAILMAGKFLLNIKWIDTLSDDELKFVLAHLATRKKIMMGQRLNHRNSKIYHLAVGMIANSLLIADGTGTPPTGTPHQPQFADYSVDEAYAFLDGHADFDSLYDADWYNSDKF